MPVFLDGQQNLAALTVPGIYGDIVLPQPFLLGLPTNIEGTVGVASWGPLNSLIPVSKPSDAALSIGPPVIRTYDISSYVSASSQVGGSIGYMCIRVSDGTDTAASTVIQSGAAFASGSAAFSINPTATDTLTLNGTVVTFVASGAAGTQVNIGNNLASTLQNLITMLQASADTQLVKFTYAIANFSLNLTAATAGVAGNSLTIAKTSTAITLSGATLTGGAAAGAPGITLSGKFSGTLGNKIQFSIQNGSQANTYMGVVVFPGMVPEQFNNVPAATPATDTLTFSGNPANTDTVTIAGTVVTFVTAAPVGNQVQIGGTQAITLANLMAFLTASTDANIIKVNQSLSGNVVTLTANINQVVGAAGNALTLAKTSTVITIGGATFSGGVGTGNTFWQNLASVINSGNAFHGPSSYVVASAGAGTAIPVLSNPVTLTGGTDGASGVTDATLMGQDIVPRKGMYALRTSNCDCFTLCDLSSISNYAAITSFALSETMFAVQASPSGDTIQNAIATRMNAGVDSPWFKYILGDWPTWYDSYNGVSRLISPAAFAIGIYGNLSPQQSALNKPLQGISSTQRNTLGQTYSDAELSLINLGGIDTILAPTSSPGGFYYSFATGRNASSNTAANGDEYTRMTNFLIRTSQSKAAGSFVGQLQSIQPNDQTRANAKSLFDGLSAQLASPQVGLGINGQGMIDRPWAVQCDLLNNPPNLQALGYLFLYWQVRYLNVIRYFVIKFQGGGNVTVTIQNSPPSPTQFASAINSAVPASA
jgi:hypothetical protein